MIGKVVGRLRMAVRSSLLLLSYLTLVVVATLGWTVAFAVIAVLTVVGEFAVAALAPETRDFLEKSGIGLIYRQLARDLATLLLLVATVDLTRIELIAVLLTFAAVWGASVVSGAFSFMIARRSHMPILTRNIDVGPLWLAPRPPEWAMRVAGAWLSYASLAMAAGAVVAAVINDFTPFVVTAGAALAAVALVAGILAWSWARGRGYQAQGQIVSAAQAWLTANQPEVAIYFAGPARDVYQVNMWLEPVEALDRPALVMLRSREAFNSLGETSLPVLCVPGAVDFMNLDVSGLRTVLYPANVGANIHMLREPGMNHVFVGHGDSDKAASVNPYSKVYDEVWVAGLAGRERYARANVGVRDDDIVEIGRPQLAGLNIVVVHPDDRPFTVLYAPTWEGWLEDDAFHTSVVLMGETIISTLIDLSPAVRVLYKPHPLTGTRSAQARAANARIVELIRTAGGEVDAETLEGPAHRTITGPAPTLFECFNEADVLISDISSVVADFVQTQRPYVVANPGGLPDDEFRRAYPTARAAYLLAPDGGELEKVVTLARTGDDPMREARRELKRYLLGSDDLNPTERFRAEISRLCG